MSSTTEKAVRLPASGNREQLMVKVARMAYQMDRTQLDIAKETGLTRWQVSRLLSEARELGVVQIEIVPIRNRVLDLETDLSAAFDLRDCVVVADSDNATDRLEAVAKAAGDYLAAMTPPPRTLGVSWGTTMSAVAHWLPQNWNRGVEVVGINGMVVLKSQVNRFHDVVELMAHKGRGSARPLPVPAVLGDAATREALERDRVVNDVLERARRSDVLCFSFGNAHHESVLVSSGNVLMEEMQALIAKGAVGDVLGRFIDINGKIVEPDIEARTVGLSLDDLREAAWSIGICAGPEKHPIALAALRSGLVNVCITDSTTAEYLLKNATPARS